MEKFNHRIAQSYELAHAKECMDNDFNDVYDRIQKNKKAGGLWQSADNIWFKGDKQLWDSFVNRCKYRKVLEIGSGPFGFVMPCYWMNDRVIIDPLAYAYKNYQIEKFNKTLFTDDIKTYGYAGECLVDELVGMVDGAIVCRNTLDHCQYPMKVLENISKYAMKGCYFLIWNEIWHKGKLDDGHRNITKEPDKFCEQIINLNFSNVSSESKETDHAIEYTGLFIKE